MLTVTKSVARQYLAMKTFILIIAAAAATLPTKPVKADIYGDMLKQHNDYRAKHNAGPLSIDNAVSYLLSQSNI